ncbi:hypothetical protein BS50DRAFT_148706 [Corynespora cassiicola Philippines]|uniref:Asl1-like glycosyl hydrolase catalytic domain-containing protein n=1 Tax=Corynespora cassiicola Philippines TaxID=1448308 RepID=A0A2T2N7J4_CORCC|nr:hypothetical protein BS50DRAFT_148706 [Corynespora cassiicola Philippines]
MSTHMKLSLLALVSTAAAIPQYGHSKFHKPSAGYGGPGAGKPYPTGGWGLNNSTALAQPTGTGAAPVPVPSDDKTTTILETQFTTETIVSTIYASRSTGAGYAAPSSVGAADVPAGSASVCGPETVYVTAVDRVTVTVPAGGAEQTSQAPEVPQFSQSYALPSSAPAAEQPSSQVPVETPAETPVETPVNTPQPSAEEVYSSQAPVETPAPSSKAPASSPAETPVPTSEAPASSAAPIASTPASSSTPVPSTPASGGYSGTKRGLAYNDIELCSSFSGAKFGFAYNWGSTEGGSLPDGIEYVPMMHRPSLSTAEEWLSNVKTAVDGGTNAVMGFNEPDHADQANLSPEAACSAWKEYMNPIKESHPGVTIIGPSVTNGPAPMGLDWLDRFQTACPDATWDAANIHFYDIYDDQVVQRFKDHIGKASSDYGKPVWVTEFGLNPGSATAEQAAQFVKEVTEFMDGYENCAGYAYFMVGTGENQLNTASGLSSIGEVYASA